MVATKQKIKMGKTLMSLTINTNVHDAFKANCIKKGQKLSHVVEGMIRDHLEMKDIPKQEEEITRHIDDLGQRIELFKKEIPCLKASVPVC